MDIFNANDPQYELNMDFALCCASDEPISRLIPVVCHPSITTRCTTQHTRSIAFVPARPYIFFCRVCVPLIASSNLRLKLKVERTPRVRDKIMQLLRLCALAMMVCSAVYPAHVYPAYVYTRRVCVCRDINTHITYTHWHTFVFVAGSQIERLHLITNSTLGVQLRFE